MKQTLSLKGFPSAARIQLVPVPTVQIVYGVKLEQANAGGGSLLAQGWSIRESKAFQA